MTTEMLEAIATIEEFLSGSGNMWAWDDFLSIPARDPLVAVVQGFCSQLRSDYPPTNRVEYCSEAGKRRLRSYLEALISKDRDAATG
jgi:hypothetical protein